MQRPGTLLASLGGADPDVLALARPPSKAGPAKDQARFAALGMVLLATAGLAVLSMTFAMTDGLHLHAPAAVMVGLFWGAIILVVDRALILSLKPKGSKWLLIGMILPRILMAALLGLVISTPLTLRIFNDEIQQQMTADNIKKAEAASTDISRGDRQKRLNDLQAQISKYEGYLAGRVPVTSPELTAAQTEYDQADKDFSAKQADADKAFAAWKCELDGQRCQAGSGKHGNGPRAQALKLVYDHKATAANAAQALVQTKQTALTAAQAASRQQDGTKVAEAQAEANRVLPGLRQQRDALQVALQGDLSSVNHDAANDTGLLARLVALSHLGDANGWARMAHLLVAGLLFMLELLPVAIKSLSILGPPTAYEQIDEIDTKEAVKLAGQHEYIDKDLEERRKRIVEKVHDEVEDVMREIALEQIEAWKQNVKQVTAAQLPALPSGSASPNSTGSWPTNGQAPTGGPAASNGSPKVPGQRSSALAKIAARFNLPPSKGNPK
jgi:hypothetical protein